MIKQLHVALSLPYLVLRKPSRGGQVYLACLSFASKDGTAVTIGGKSAFIIGLLGESFPEDLEREPEITLARCQRVLSKRQFRRLREELEARRVSITEFMTAISLELCQALSH